MNNYFNILRAVFEGFSTQTNLYSNCVILFRENNFSRLWLQKTISKNNFLVCSEIKIDLLYRDRCQEQGGDFWEAYMKAEKEEYFFENFPEPGFSNVYYYGIPRFSELDFESLISQLGGGKISETNTKTPDFLLGRIAIELKDMQDESMYNTERRTSIAKIFESDDSYSININISSINDGCIVAYKRLIANSIKNIVKKASAQIKEYAKTNEINSAGVFLINSGYFSLDHTLFKTIVEEIIIRETKTIKFAYIFTQSVRHNAIGDLQADYMQDFIGDFPEELKAMKEVLEALIKRKMVSIFQPYNNETSFVPAQQPISFFADDKFFYWKPKRVAPSMKF